MPHQKGTGNVVHESAQLSPDLRLGSFNHIGRNVVIDHFKGANEGPIAIGDCNTIHDGARILAGPDGISIGDWNVFHNSMLVMGDRRLEIGHNCWFGQNTILDSSGCLSIGNGVRVGMYSQIWTHVASGELIEGCTLYATRPTVIEDDVWLVGSCTVGSGLTLRRRSIVLIGSVLTRDTEAGMVFGGAPAKWLEKLNFWREVTLEEKFEMMENWARQFAGNDPDVQILIGTPQGRIVLSAHETEETLVFDAGKNVRAFDQSTSYFDLETKTYTKRLTRLERNFYRSVFGHKARFLPFEDS